MPANKLAITFTALAVNTGDRMILIDSGNAPGGTAGRMADNLAAAGIATKDVDHVLISHFHGDHIGGVRKADGTAVFANAELMVPDAEWGFWMDDAQISAAPEGMKGAFANVRRVFSPDAAKVNRFGWGKEILPGITAVEAGGHTPGHTAFVIASGNDRMMFVADITDHPGDLCTPGRSGRLSSIWIPTRPSSHAGAFSTWRRPTGSGCRSITRHSRRRGS